MTAAIIRASFSDFKLVKGRKVAQLVFEVPTEQSDAALRALGGCPQPHEDRWCALALLVPDAPARPMPEEPAATAPSVTVGGKPWRDMKFAQQAGILSSDADFIAWLRVPDEKAAADHVRRLCGVTSRADLDKDPDAAERWLKISHDFFGRSDAASQHSSLMNGRH